MGKLDLAALLVELVDLHVVLAFHLVEFRSQHGDVGLRLREIVLEISVLVNGVIQFLLGLLRVLLVLLFVEVSVNLE